MMRRGRSVVFPVALETDLMVNLGPDLSGDRLSGADARKVPEIALGESVHRDHVGRSGDGQPPDGEETDRRVGKEDRYECQYADASAEREVQLAKLPTSPMVPMRESHAVFPFSRSP